MKACLTKDRKNIIKYPWKTKNGISFKGYFYNDDSILTDNQVFDLFSRVQEKDDFINVLTRTNGYFSILINVKNFVFAAVDRVASTPLLFKIEKDIMIGDNFELFISPKSEINRKSLDQYLASGYAYGEDTILSGVSQLLAGSALILEKTNLEFEVVKYYEYLPNPNFQSGKKTINEYLKELDAVHVRVFERLVRGLAGRQVILPLSGGYDSRLILEMLIRLNYENILCVTWGSKNDWQVKIAESVASSFGVRWVCVDQSFSDWCNWYRRGGVFEQLRFCGAIGSIPYMQENIVIDFLERNLLIEEDSIFLNGNSGDFIEGEHIPSNIDNNISDNFEIIQILISKHLRLNKLTSYSEIISYLDAEIQNFRDRGLDVRLFFEYWEWFERQSKFVTNCIKPFEVGGYEWRMPFWENEIMDFWANIPIDIKKERSLFYKYYNKYMNTDISVANPKVSVFRRYYERLKDPRFGMYFDGAYCLNRVFGNKKSHYDRFVTNNMKNEKFFLMKLNSILSLDVSSKIKKMIETI